MVLPGLPACHPKPPPIAAKAEPAAAQESNAVSTSLLGVSLIGAKGHRLAPLANSDRWEVYCLPGYPKTESFLDARQADLAQLDTMMAPLQGQLDACHLGIIDAPLIVRFLLDSAGEITPAELIGSAWRTADTGPKAMECISEVISQWSLPPDETRTNCHAEVHARRPVHTSPGP